MKTPIKTLASFLVLAFFLLIGWATSYDKDFDFNLVDFSFHNDSDSCTVSDISAVFRARRDNDDTLLLLGIELAPGDTFLQTLERLKYRELDFTCNCPNDTFLQVIDLRFDTLEFEEIHIDCD